MPVSLAAKLDRRKYCRVKINAMFIFRKFGRMPSKRARVSELIVSSF
jgi:hypothetical protein